MPVLNDASLVKLLDSDTAANVEPRISVMFGIFFVSLFAVSFPVVSERIPFLRIPHIVFFIGKHFGTGVILSTAFCHLLPDAFESLGNPAIKEGYHGVANWTGMIMLSSLLFIFLVEYVSTSYVDHLNADPSTPSSPVASPAVSRPGSPPPAIPTDRPLDQADSTTYFSHSVPQPAHSRTITPDHLPPVPEPILSTTTTESTPLIGRTPKRTKSLCSLVHAQDEAILSLVILTSPRLLAHSGLICGRHPGCICVTGRRGRVHSQPRERDGATVDGGGDGYNDSEPKPKIGRRRQVVGILVLQLGIMIHSLVIGLTLAVTSGADFTSLVTAIIFHQLFEGLSLGIRIAALPPVRPLSVSSSSSNIPSHSPYASSVSLDSSFAPPQSCSSSWLNSILSILFAITTPVGMAIGLMAFSQDQTASSPDQAAQMYLIQGLMSAISAGMLIYAATVEMIAGDFVFGDVGAEHAHEHSHAHGHGHEHSEPVEDKRSKTWKKVLAVVSLLIGVAGMAMVGE